MESLSSANIIFYQLDKKAVRKTEAHGDSDDDKALKETLDPYLRNPP